MVKQDQSSEVKDNDHEGGEAVFMDDSDGESSAGFAADLARRSLEQLSITDATIDTVLNDIGRIMPNLLPSSTLLENSSQDPMRGRFRHHHSHSI